jgi:hypothetical protein
MIFTHLEKEEMDRSLLIYNVFKCVTKILSTPSQEFVRHRLANLPVVNMREVRMADRVQA